MLNVLRLDRLIFTVCAEFFQAASKSPRAMPVWQILFGFGG